MNTRCRISEFKVKSGKVFGVIVSRAFSITAVSEGQTKENFQIEVCAVQATGGDCTEAITHPAGPGK